ncbi:cell division ATP-binding protein FtsE [Phenylobacterium sp.]|jgi:cell division transport system ATP-binding protein|uniref:cell division ATP-binding protein FtsE n=1 Tax=Phenylobacterium sp. TaxID=1871053 RepID=UPI002620D2C9|nr:cell division ATP-binding protein FtsE [Phenylobacterium sp.]
MSRNPYAADVTDADDAVVRFDDVSMRYGRAPETLRDLTFSLPQGSFHFVTGPSGAGKTSLLKLIYLAAQPSKGLLHLFGQNVAQAPADIRPFLRRRIGVVFQEFRLLDHMSAFDNAAIPLRIAGAKPDSYRQDVAELLSWVGLKDRMHALPPTLAGGEKQRLAIARAVVGRPDILLADEPTGNVDHAMGLRILRLFLELNRLGTTVLIATHDQDLVARSGKPILHLEDGRLVHMGPVPQGFDG